MARRRTPGSRPDQASGHGLDDVPRRVVFVQRVSSTVSETPAFTSNAKAGSWSSRSVSGSCCARSPARRSTPPSSRLGLPPYGGGRLLLATAAVLEPLDHGAPWAALFGALFEEATSDRVAYPTAFACASLLSHALKLLELTCSFNFPAWPPHHRPRRTARRAACRARPACRLVAGPLAG